MIASNRPLSLNGLPKLHIRIWPPHPDRSVDIVELSENVLKLRKRLCSLPQIPKLFVWFENTRSVNWCQYEEHQLDLKYYHRYWHNDMEMLLDHFARITKLQGITIRLAGDLAHNVNMRLYAVGELKETELYSEFELRRWDKADGPFVYDPYPSISMEMWVFTILPSVPIVLAGAYPTEKKTHNLLDCGKRKFARII